MSASLFLLVPSGEARLAPELAHLCVAINIIDKHANTEQQGRTGRSLAHTFAHCSVVGPPVCEMRIMRAH